MFWWKNKTRKLLRQFLLCKIANRRPHSSDMGMVVLQISVQKLSYASDTPNIGSQFCAFLPRERERLRYSYNNFFLIKIAESSFESSTISFFSLQQPFKPQSLFFALLLRSSLLAEQSTVNFLPFLSLSESAQWMCIISKLFTCFSHIMSFYGCFRFVISFIFHSLSNFLWLKQNKNAEEVSFLRGENYLIASFFELEYFFWHTKS